MDIAQEYREKLFELQDIEYKEFNSKLLPTVDPDLVIGVRTPKLRSLAKQLAKTSGSAAYFDCLPHRYFEENNLHGFMLESIRDFEQCLKEIDRFLPYVDNWATCDMVSPGVFKKHLPELLIKIKEWIRSDRTYTVRYGLGMLMRYYLDEEFREEYLELAGSVRSEEYYINMMIAWYFATALAKQWEATIPWISERRLPEWVHNKSIQKAIESLRITPEQKQYLRSLRIKKAAE